MHHSNHEENNHPEMENKHAGHTTAMFAKRFWVSLALTIPVVFYSPLVREAFDFRPPDFFVASWLPLILASTVFFYGGWVFLRGALGELKARRPGMMTLIALAVVAAYLYSVFATFAVKETLFWELTTLITIMLLGHWIEMRAVAGAQGALKELAKLLPDKAEVIRGNKSEIIPLSELREGDIVLVKPGGKLPADGEIVEGKSEVNESMITGESKPADKTTGDIVIAGTINGDGSLKVRISQIGEKTFLAGVMRLVAEAEKSKSKLQMLSDRAAFYLTIIAVGAGAVTFIAWLLAEAGFATATERLVAVLVIACPHALGLAVPLVASISTTMAAKNGLLVKKRLALEAARNINVVLFDKTGTLTKGKYGVAEIIPGAESQEDQILQLAASVNSHSEHPVARAQVIEAQKRDLQILSARDFQRIAGRGSQGLVNGRPVAVGSERMMREKGIQIPKTLTDKVNALAKQGDTINYVVAGERLLGAIALSDVIREESRTAIKSLKSLGLQVAMITGDSEDVAEWVSEELGIDEYFAKVLPGEKAEKVKELQRRGLKVAMVGDGVNDAPALTQADLGVAIGAGTNVAIESAGIILVKSDPRDIPKIITLSRLTYKKMMQNLFWATGYNVIALPLAAGVLAGIGIILQPAFAAILMSLSTVIVAINALLLRRQELAI